MLRNWSTTTSVPAGAEENSASRAPSRLRTGALASTPPVAVDQAGPVGGLADVQAEHGRGPGGWRFHGGILPVVVRPDGLPSALTLPAAAPARHFPISRRGRRVPRRQHPTGPLGGRDVRPCAGARSAARSGRASIVARDGPGLTISTVMDVLKRLHSMRVDNLPVWACVRAQSGRLSTLICCVCENPRSFLFRLHL